MKPGIKSPSDNKVNTQNVPDNKYNLYPEFDQRWATEPKLKYNPLLPMYSYRQCFKPAHGKKYICVDYSQIELRIAAEVSNDEVMMEMVRAGGDLHSRTASLMFNKPLEECGPNSDYRKAGKQLNFAVIYGLGDLALAESLGYDVTSSEKIRKKSMRMAAEKKKLYFKTFRGLHAYTVMMKEHPFTIGHTTTILGRKRWYTLPDREKVPGWAADGIEASLRNQGVNSPIQGASADMLKIAKVLLADEFLINGYDACIVNTVHDELLVEVEESIADKVKDIVEHNMCIAGSMMLKKVPVEVEIKVADCWDKH